MVITERLSRETAREYALRILKNNIITLELAPGSMVSENEISVQLGLSRTPVREALIELSRVNIMEILPQKGSRVLLIDYALVEESRFLRLVLENAIVKLMCETPEELDLSSLDDNLKLQDFYIENPNPEKLLELDNHFHSELFRISKKVQCFLWMMDGMTVHFDRVRSMSLNTIKDIKIVNDHKALVQAIREKKADEAVTIMTKHLSRYKIDESAIRDKYPLYFC